MVAKKYSYSAIASAHSEALSERSEWEAEWRQVSENLLPGRGIYQTYSRPRKRKLTNVKTVNTIAEDSLYVLTSGMHSGLTSPSRPWFKLTWADDKLKEHEPLKAWLQDCEKRLHAALHSSNFYSIINSFYIEYAGFGTGCMYVGEDSNTELAPFRFELLTAGEYSFSASTDGRASVFYRTIVKSARQVVKLYPNTVSEKLKTDVKQNKPGIDVLNIVLLEYIVKEKYKDKDFTKVVYEMSSGTASDPQRGAIDDKVTKGKGKGQQPLEVSGYYEFPYPVGRWGTIGSDVYGIGPGSRALPHIKRLQEMEKAFLMATHKTIAPPLNAPARMKGKLQSMPGGYNYYSNPQEVVSEIYKVRFDFNGVSAAIERVEQRIQKIFFNDIFLTAARDPNASPLKATQVNVQEQEKMLRLGPVIERLQHEVLQPLLERCFNIMLRKQKFMPLSPDLVELAGDYTIAMVSPLATAQRGIALQGIQSFMGFVGQAAQFDQTILDNINVDNAARDLADITGVEIGILRPQAEVDQIRKDRAATQAQAKAKEEQLIQAQAQGQLDSDRADTMKTQAEAGQINLETGQLAEDLGMM